MNVLITCAGRRGYLIRSFQAALGDRGSVFATDAAPDAPALQVADGAFIVPRVDEPGYVDRILEICRERGIQLLISLNDLELPAIAASRDRFRAGGTVAVISTPEVVRTCADKWATARFLRACGIAVPATVLHLPEALECLRNGTMRFPLAVKPRWGSASVGVDRVTDAEELRLVYELERTRFAEAPPSTPGVDRQATVLIQQWIDGDEYGMDVINDLEGRYMTTFARRKLLMRAGETDRAMTLRAEPLERLGSAIGRALGHVGVLDCDVFLGREGRPMVLEMNARFGGGYPFEEAAGANVPAALIAWRSGVAADDAWLRPTPNVTSSKTDGLVTILPTAWPEEPDPEWMMQGC